MSTPRRTVFSLTLHSILLVSLLALSGCVSTAWKKALNEDTPAAYYRFMREHGESNYADQARERLEFHKLKRNPTLAGFAVFRKSFPNSELIEALHPALEKPAFEVALAQGTATAYREFLESFPNGALAKRAEGNAVYMEAGGFGGDAYALGEFAGDHPASDFAAEARRTADAAVARKSQRFTHMGLRLSIAASTPEAKRVHEALSDQIEELTKRVGIQIVPLRANQRIPANRVATTAHLDVRHSETEVAASAKSGGLSRSSRLATTDVVLRESEGGAIIAEHRFELRVDDKAHVPGTSVLFSGVSPKYWAEFFVPAARWRNDRAVRPPIELGDNVVDVDAVGDRAVVLYENGDFEMLGLADPEQPTKLSAYRRGENMKRWSGVRILGSRIAIFGEEGLELVRFGENGPVAEVTWQRGQIGRILSIASLGDKLVLVGAKGMQLMDLTTGKVRRLMRRVIMSVGSTKQVIVFADGESIYISSLALLAEGRVIAQMKLGRTFGPNNVRVIDNAAIVTGPGGAMVIDLKNPQAPKALAKISTRDVGEIVDATRVRGRVFLVGSRGAMLLNRKLTAVEETIDVGARNRVAVMGRHFVTASREGVQVVDASPWAANGAPAAAGTVEADALLNGSGF